MTQQMHKDLFSYIKLLFSKSLFGFTLIFLSGFLTLIYLGSWQLNRLGEKTELIAKMQSKLTQDPSPFEDLLLAHLQNDQDIEFVKTTLVGKLHPKHHFKLMSQTHDGKMGYHYISILSLETGGAVLVDLGWVPMEQNSQEISLPTETVKLQGVVRYGTETNAFTPDNQYESLELYAIDPLEVQDKAELKDLYPVYVSNILQGPTAEGQITKVPFQLSIRNQHLTYAMTWFSLAIVWLLCFIFFVRGRLRSS